MLTTPEMENSLCSSDLSLEANYDFAKWEALAKEEPILPKFSLSLRSLSVVGNEGGLNLVRRNSTYPSTHYILKLKIRTTSVSWTMHKVSCLAVIVVQL